MLLLQARSGLLATGPAGGLGVSHGGGQGDKSVCGVRAAPRKISQFKVLKRPYSAPQVILLRLNRFTEARSADLGRTAV